MAKVFNRKNLSEPNVQGPVLNEVKDTHLERSFEAQDARGAHFEPGTLNFRAPDVTPRFPKSIPTDLKIR
jgi:hypothetical protein